MEQEKYCSYCGKTLATKQGYKLCPSCDNHVYQNPVPTVGVFLVKNGKVLLARRRQKPLQGTLDIVGGFMNIGELPETTAHREVKEETGLTIKLDKLLGFYKDDYKVQPAKNVNLLTIIYVGHITRGKPFPRDDVSELIWYELSNPPLQQVGFKSIRKALQDLSKQKI